MGSDYPDWGGQYNRDNFYPLFDLAEHAARIGSPVTYDRRGSVIWWDDFGYGIDKWSLYAPQGYGQLDLTASVVHTGAFAMYLKSTGANNERVYARRREPVLSSGTIGFSVMLKRQLAGGDATIGIWHYDGSARREYEFGYVFDSNSLCVWDSDGSFTVVASAANLFTSSNFQHVKLVVDIAARKYVRSIVGETEFDLSSYGPYEAVDAADKKYDVFVAAQASPGMQSWVSIDRAILTAAE